MWDYGLLVGSIPVTILGFVLPTMVVPFLIVFVVLAWPLGALFASMLQR